MVFIRLAWLDVAMIRENCQNILHRWMHDRSSRISIITCFHFQILKFADDTKVFGKVMDEKDKGRPMLQTDLNKLTSWAQKWKTEFNVAKCKVMHTGNNNNEFSYEMNGKQWRI